MKKLRCVVGQSEGSGCQNFEYGSCKLNRIQAYLKIVGVETEAICGSYTLIGWQCGICGVSDKCAKWSDDEFDELCMDCYGLLHGPRVSKAKELKALVARARLNGAVDV